MEQININDTLDIVLVKLDLTISEREQVESIVKDDDIGYEETEGYLMVIIGEDKTNEIINWMRLNQY